MPIRQPDAARRPDAASTPEASTRPLDAEAFDYWQAHHLLLRAGFGGTPAEVRDLANLGLDRAVDRLVRFADAPAPSDEVGFDPDIMRPESPEEQRRYRQALQQGDEEVVAEFRQRRQAAQREDRQQLGAMRRWWIERFANTARPLEEKMTLFWHGHFATGYRAIEDSWHLMRQQQLFRTHALGDFKQLTHGIIRDPAMLEYLNNDRNVARRPNENLARELMELFTLGEGNGYSEQDIKESARALTGYHFEDDTFVFNRRQHDEGPKRILGRQGTFDGDDLVDLIFAQPAAAEFVVLKLYRYFVHDLPGGEIDLPRRRFLTALAADFRRSGFDVGRLLHTLFRSEHFYHPSNRTSRIRSPVELYASTVRTLGTPPRDTRSVEDALATMGQELFEPPSVRGWPGGRTWINTSTLFARQNFGVYLLTGRRPRAWAWRDDRAPYDPVMLIEPLLELDPSGADPTTVAGFLLHHALGAPPHPDRVRPLADFLADRGGRLDAGVLTGLLCLIVGLPEYQLT
jgi:predicted nuclease of restriction endonuclease-like (RecB) superfamily